MAKMIAAIELTIIQKNIPADKEQYGSTYGDRFLDFLASFQYLDPEIKV